MKQIKLQSRISVLFIIEMISVSQNKKKNKKKKPATIIIRDVSAACKHTLTPQL